MTATFVIVLHTEASQRCNQVLRYQGILKLAEEFYTLSGAHKLYGTGTGNHWSSTLSTQTVMWSNFLALNFNLIVNWKVAAAEIHIKEHCIYFDVTKAYTTLLALSPVSCPSEILYNFGNVPEMIFAHYLQMAFSKWSWTQWNTDRKRQQDNDLKVSKQQSYRAGPGLQGRSWTIPSS